MGKGWKWKNWESAGILSLAGGGRSWDRGEFGTSHGKGVKLITNRWKKVLPQGAFFIQPVEENIWIWK